jgi:hypothetical protein
MAAEAVMLGRSTVGGVRAAAVAAAVLLAVTAGAPAGAACGPTPAAGCKQPFTAGRSSLKFVQTGRTDPDDVYTWKWNFGAQTEIADFGFPTASTGYALCIYDASPRPQPMVGNVAGAGPGWSSPPHQAASSITINGTSGRAI